MIAIEEIANELHVSREELLQRSVVSYMERLLFKAEADILRITSRHGVQTVEDLDRLLLAGKTSETAVFEDYFTLDALLAERKKLQQLLDTAQTA